MTIPAESHEQERLSVQDLLDAVDGVDTHDDWAEYWTARDEQFLGREYDSVRQISLKVGGHVVFIEHQYTSKFEPNELYGTLLMHMNGTDGIKPKSVFWRAGLTPVEGDEPRSLPDDGDPVSDASLNWWHEHLTDETMLPTLLWNRNKTQPAPERSMTAASVGRSLLTRFAALYRTRS